MSSPGAVIARCNNCGNTQGFQISTFGSEGISACPGVGNSMLLVTADVSQCGLTMGESDMQMQDELTKMFNQSMSLQQRPPPTPDSRLSISQHYHHSTHLQELAQTPAQGISDSEAIEILTRNGIEAIHLSFSQAALFKKADPAQKDRLIELWRISPPQPGDWQGSSGPQQTSVQMEEELARKRYAAAAQPVVEIEPYIRTVFDESARSTYSPYGSAVGSNQAHGAEWWKDFMGNQPMELQYGMLEYMNHQAQSTAAAGGEDCEMH